MTNTSTHTQSPSISVAADGGPAERVDTVIVGAGQAGLSTAYFLERAGHDYVVLDQHARVGDQWRRRYDSLVLNTPARNSGLPGHPFPRSGGAFPTAAELADHLEEYTRRYRLPVRGGVTVRSVQQQDDGRWRVDTDGGAYDAANVVVATGVGSYPKVPALHDRLDPGIRQLHSSEYRNPGQLLPGRTLVVGIGQSGADIAIELARAGHEVHASGVIHQEVPVDIDSLKGRLGFRVLWLVWNHLLTERTAKGRALKAAIRDGSHVAPLIRVKARDLDEAGVRRTEARTTDVAGGKPVLDDGTVLDVANVVWCTGYRQDLSFIQPSPLGEDGWPRDDGGVMTDLPGLYFMGLLFQRGFYSMLVGGAGRDAQHIARHILQKTPTPVAG
jgi:putative flavoprotein involved in K+ transport